MEKNVWNKPGVSHNIKLSGSSIKVFSGQHYSQNLSNSITQSDNNQNCLLNCLLNQKKDKLGKERILNPCKRFWAFFPFRNKKWKWTLERQQSVDEIFILSSDLETLVTKVY